MNYNAELLQIIDKILIPQRDSELSFYLAFMKVGASSIARIAAAAKKEDGYYKFYKKQIKYREALEKEHPTVVGQAVNSLTDLITKIAASPTRVHSHHTIVLLVPIVHHYYVLFTKSHDNKQV